MCVNEAKGDLISIGTLLEGRLDFFYYSYGGLNEYIHFWGVVKECLLAPQTSSGKKRICCHNMSCKTLCGCGFWKQE